MGKTKPFSFRISSDLYDSVKKLADFFNLSLADLVERLLLYFKYNPDEIVDLKMKKTITAQKEQEVFQLQKNPEQAFISIRETGIETIGQLCWIASLMQQAWGASRGTATALWVNNIAKAILLLLRTNLKNIDELTPYLLATYPASTPEDVNSEDLSSKVNSSIAVLSKVEKIDKFHADMVTRCFEVLVRDGEFDISQELLNKMKSLLEPWCFWVAKRAILRGPLRREIDTTILLRKSTPTKHTILIPETPQKTDLVRVEIFLPSFLFSDGIFSCGFSFTDPNNRNFTVACRAKTLDELYEAISILERGNIIAEYGAWQLMREEKQGAYSIRKDGVLNFLTREEFDTFIKLAKEAYNLPDVQSALTFEFAEEYGAV